MATDAPRRPKIPLLASATTLAAVPRNDGAQARAVPGVRAVVALALVPAVAGVPAWVKLGNAAKSSK